VPDTNYLYPILRRKIKLDFFSQDVDQGSWVFVDVNDLAIDEYISSSLTLESQQNSYLVVYHSDSQDDYNFVAVKSHIIDERLYFQTAESHTANEPLTKTYNLYYKTDNLKSIKKVSNGQYEDYIRCIESDAEFVTSTSDVDEAFFDVNPSTNSTYVFSFINPEVDWQNGLSLIPGAKVYGNFTGPQFELYCDKGPDFGKFEIRFVALADTATPNSFVQIDWTFIDLYSETTQKNALVYSKSNFFYQYYIFEIRANYEKNPLSKDGKIKIGYYSYSYDPKAQILAEEISPSLFTRRVLGGTV
jgi:hypothetical protein